jgi:hypothetical protein
MLPLELYRSFIQPLHQTGISYMITGSFAAILYGEPRLTVDVDLVIACNSKDLPLLTKAFPEKDYYMPPLDLIQLELARETRGHWNVIDWRLGMKADFYPINRDPLHRWALAKKNLRELEEGGLWLAPPEYVILRKLQYFQEGGSDKHLRDIDRMLSVSESLIDQTLLQEKIQELKLQDAWNKLPK